MIEKRYFNRELETMSREQLLKYQWDLLQKQIRYTYEKSGLCQRKFKEAKITPDDIKTWEDFTNKVPFTTKQDLLADQLEKPPYGTRLSISENEIFIVGLTSGTSGRGQEVHAKSRGDAERYGSPIFVWAGWGKGDKAMLPLPIALTVAAPILTGAMQKLGVVVFHLGPYDTKTKLEYMKRFKINCAISSTAYLETLTAEAERLGLDPARDLALEKVVMFGQAYPISFIHKMEEKWNCKIYDYYGTTQEAGGACCEKGPVIGDQRGYYHLFDYRAYHEIIDPETGKLVGPGEVGEMVVTPLRKEASPFLRFRLSDKVRWFPPEACDCGRPFGLLEAGTVARYDDMMKIKGINVWPETIDEIVLTKEETAEYQGRVYISDDRKEKAEISVEFKVDVPQDVKQRLLSRISDEVRDTTGIGFITKEAEGELLRWVVKPQRWTDERIKGLEKKRMA